MENTTGIVIQKHYLFLGKMNHLHDMGYKVVTNTDLEKKLAKNIKLWVNLDKKRKVSDPRAFIDGTFSELSRDKYIDRVGNGEYRINDAGRDFLEGLSETLIENFDFEFPQVNSDLSEEEAYEAIVVHKQFEYSPAEYEILTDEDIAELALEDYQNVCQYIYF